MPTLHDLTIPAYTNGLRALSGQLVKALDWGEQNGVGELQFIAARLAPDMFPLAAQVRFTCAQAIQTAVRLGADNAPDLGEDAASRSVGGLGIHLVRELASAAHYARVADRNVLDIRLVRTSASNGVSS